MTAARLHVLILGGYGTFGGRLAQLLAGEERLTLTIAGRSHVRAANFCARLDGRAQPVPLSLDRDGDVEGALRALAPDLIVDASGPFQSYGEDPYRVVRAALALGIHYLDLADGAHFVAGISQFDAAARAREIFVLSGMSSFPVLTAAAMRSLSAGMTRIDAVTAGIAPSPYAGVGLNVIRAIASYAGKPVALVEDGKPSIRHALVDTRRMTIAPPGRLPLANVRFSLVDVPDLQLLPVLWPSLRSVWVGAGPVPEILHRGLNALAWLVRLRIVPSLSRLAPLLHRVSNVVRWGEHRGGMFVAIAGIAGDGSRIARAWHLLAEGDAGPLIPSMAAAAIIHRCLQGRPPAPGARAGMTDVELDDYDALFAPRGIVTGRRETSARTASWPLYRRLLRDAFAQLPPALQAMHDLDGAMRAEGIATVERGSGFLARLVAVVFRLPAAGENVPVSVQFDARGGREIWRRTFAGRSFSTVQEAGRGRFDQLLGERFGPLYFGLALVVASGRLWLIVRRWSFLGLPLPLRLAPFGEACEFMQDGRFRFDVEIRLPLLGRIVRYRGWLVPRGSIATAAAVG
jgi:Domain of unknown function (DUF4166)/Saccharopine dehydrogenase NADP binding domain